jgi:hypothetical protein
LTTRAFTFQTRNSLQINNLIFAFFAILVANFASQKIFSEDRKGINRLSLENLSRRVPLFKIAVGAEFPLLQRTQEPALSAVEGVAQPQQKVNRFPQ